MTKLSVTIATFNEEENIKSCLKTVKDIADEIVVVDGGSVDRTVEIAKEFNAKVTVTDNPPNFHINKQKANDLAENDWILQLDADERVTATLDREIKNVIRMGVEELEDYQASLKNKKLFLRHQKLLEERDGKIGIDQGEFVAFFVPRANYFLGKYLRYGGVYPDGVIRLFKKDKAFLPCKSVHEQYQVDGRVGWLQNNLLHIDSPTFKRYLQRNNRYISLIVRDLARERVKKNIWQLLNYCLIKPVWWFIKTQLIHKGILDGIPGVIFSFFSALRFPRAYIKYLLT